MTKDMNKLNQDEIDAQRAGEPKRVAIDLETDKFSDDEKKAIAKMVTDTIPVCEAAMDDWVEQKKIDIMHINCEKPSVIENLTKRTWMSDRNLGLCAGILDIYQATLLSTCLNPNSINFVATEKNDVDNKDNLERFAKWGLGQQEADFFPEADDYINNKVGLGFSIFKIYWEVTYKWIDKRIPKRSKENKNRITGYDIKTEKRRFERGVIKNIDNVEDILFPSYSKSIQSLPYMMERVHVYWSDLLEMSERKIIDPLSETIKNHFKGIYLSQNSKQSLRKEDIKYQGITDVQDDDIMSLPIDYIEWYGEYTKDGRKERYRFLVEPITKTFLSGKPLRKIRRDGKYPYVGGPLRRRPLSIRGGSLTSLIAPAINAINNVYNQKSDFQYIENCPFGFKQGEEGENTGTMEVEPGVMYITEGDPTKSVYFPNLSRSLAWAERDIQFLLEVIERLTGAASYFLTSQAKGSTATRDSIVEQKGETKFGLWVKRILSEFSEAINMWLLLYQDYAPPKLGERVLGEDGKNLIRNLSIDTLRGSYDARMEPDVTNGSKIFDRQMKLWGLNELSRSSVWFDPRMNPRGSWKITEESMRAMGYQNPEKYLPPQPKEAEGESNEIKEEWNRFIQGESFDPPEGSTPAVKEHLAGHMKQKAERYHELDEEYRNNFDDHLFKTQINYEQFVKQQQNEMVVQQIASKAVDNLKALQGEQQPQQPMQQAQPEQPEQMQPDQANLGGMEQ